MLSIASTTHYSCLARTKFFVRPASSRLNLFYRRYALASLPDINTESKANIIRYIRSFEDKGLVVPWNDLATSHKISEASLRQIVADDTAERQKQQELSVKITEAAVSPDRYFDKEKGLCNWEALSTDFGIPLVDCLRAFNPAKASHKLRSMPQPSEWTNGDKVMLHSLIHNTFKDPATTEWPLVGVYMNTEPESCKSAVFFKRPGMSPELFEDIQKLQKQGLKWSQIHSQYPYFASKNSLSSSYFAYKRNAKITSTSAVWSKADTQRTLDLLWNHRYDISEDVERVVALAVLEFPNLPEDLVCKQVCLNLKNLRKDYFNFSNCNRLQQLVAEHDEDWKRIDSELGTFPGAAKYNWRIIKGLNLTKTWSLEDTKRLYHCINTNMSTHDSVRYIKTKSPRQYQNIKHKLNTQGIKRMQLECSTVYWRYRFTNPFYLVSSHEIARAGSANKTYGKNAQWSDEEKVRLFELAALSTDVANTTWESIAKQLGRPVIKCVYTYHMLQASDWRPSTVSNESKVKMVTRACKEEYISAGCIDWAKVSKLTGLNQLECMEVCDMEDYKRQWIYDPKTFSWDDANRMTDFIAANYPGTLPVNYRAVSNYMWIKIGDCINMHNMLHGKFRWTDDIIERVVQMRSQGHKFRYIGNQLSPLLSTSTVGSAYSKHTRVHTPISKEEKRHITELVDKYVGKVPVKEVLQKVKSESACWSYYTSRYADKYIRTHAYYKKRLAGMDLTEITDPILAGKLTIKQAAAELDITTKLLGDAVRCLKARDYSSRWTAAETEQLVAYVRSLGDSKPDWVYFSKLIGSKHVLQCSSKYGRFKSKL